MLRSLTNENYTNLCWFTKFIVKSTFYARVNVYTFLSHATQKRKENLWLFQNFFRKSLFLWLCPDQKSYMIFPWFQEFYKINNHKIKLINIKNHIHYYINNVINTSDLNFGKILWYKNIKDKKLSATLDIKFYIVHNLHLLSFIK